jgi:hypothetical protein
VSPIFNKKHALVKNALAGITIPWYNAGGKLDNGWPESEKHVFQAALGMVVVKKIR